MRIKDFFQVGGLTQVLSGTGEYLTDTNCVVVNKTKGETDILLHMRRDSDGLEGDSHLRVLPEYEEVASQLVNLAFSDDRVTGITIADMGKEVLAKENHCIIYL